MNVRAVPVLMASVLLLSSCAPVARPDIPPDAPIDDRSQPTSTRAASEPPAARASADRVLAAVRARIPDATIRSCERVLDHPPGQRHDAFRCSGIYVEHGDECVATFLARGATVVAGPLNPVCEPEFPWQGR